MGGQYQIVAFIAILWVRILMWRKAINDVDQCDPFAFNSLLMYFVLERDCGIVSQIVCKYLERRYGEVCISQNYCPCAGCHIIYSR